MGGIHFNNIFYLIPKYYQYFNTNEIFYFFFLLLSLQNPVAFLSLNQPHFKYPVAGYMWLVATIFQYGRSEFQCIRIQYNLHKLAYYTDFYANQILMLLAYEADFNLSLMWILLRVLMAFDYLLRVVHTRVTVLQHVACSLLWEINKSRNPV